MSNFIKIRPVGSESVQMDGQTYGSTKTWRS